MKRDQTHIAQILLAWKNITSAPKQEGFFSKNDHAFRMSKLLTALNLHALMSIEELTHALSILETLSITPSSSNTSFCSWLEQNRYRLLQDIDIQAKSNAPKFDIPTRFIPCLVKTHQTLLNHLELAYAHAKGQIPVRQVNYEPDQIRTSQAFNDLETTSQCAQLPDNSTIIDDIKRKGVTINHSFITANEASLIQKEIEAFTGDKIYKLHSKANKIFNFGGQFLEGILLQEFKNTAGLAKHEDYQLEPAIVKGNINWLKKTEQQEFYAQVNLKILTCNLFNPVNACEMPQLIAVGSDGQSLVSMGDEEELEAIMKRCLREKDGETQRNVVPVSEIDATIKLTANDLHAGYMLELDSCQISFNSPEIISLNCSPSIRKNTLGLN